MGRQIAGASAPSCQPGLCPCPCCINYPASPSTTPIRDALSRIGTNPELAALNGDTTALLNRLRSHVLPNPAVGRSTSSSSPASDIRISTSVSASRTEQPLPYRYAPFPTNMLPPRLGTPVPTTTTTRATQSDSNLDLIMPDTLPPLPASSSAPSALYDRSVSTAIRARLEELDEQIARTMLRSERNRARNSVGSADASMDRVNTAIENSRSALSQARDAIRNALRHSERLERIAGVLRRQAFSNLPGAPTEPGSPELSTASRPDRPSWAFRTTVSSSGSVITTSPETAVAATSSTVDGEHAGIQTNLDRSLADLRAASREIDRVIGLAARDRSSFEPFPEPEASDGSVEPLPSLEDMYSESSTPESSARQFPLSRLPLPPRIRPSTNNQSNPIRDAVNPTFDFPRRPSRTRWLSGDSAGVPLSTQQNSSGPSPSQSDSQPSFEALRSATSAAASTSTLSQASAELRSSTVALARRVLANSRATRATSAGDQAVARPVSSSGSTRDISTRTVLGPEGALDVPSGRGIDPYAALTAASSRRERLLAARALVPASQTHTPAAQQSSSSAYNPSSGEGETTTAAVGEIRQTSSSRPVSGFEIRPEHVGALSYLTQESDDEDPPGRAPAAAGARSTIRTAAQLRERTSPPTIAAMPALNAGTPITAEELAVLNRSVSDNTDDSDDTLDEDDELEDWPPTRPPPLRPIGASSSQLGIDGRVTSNLPRRNIGGWRQVDANGDVIEPNGGLSQSEGRDGISGGNGRGWYWTPPAVAGIMNEEGEEKIPLSPGDGRDADGQPRSVNRESVQSRDHPYSGNREMIGR